MTRDDEIAKLRAEVDDLKLIVMDLAQRDSINIGISLALKQDNYDAARREMAQMETVGREIINRIGGGRVDDKQ